MSLIDILGHPIYDSTYETVDFMSGIMEIKNDIRRDVIVAIISIISIFLLLHLFDAFEELYDFTRSHEDWEVDEIILLLLCVPLPLAWLIYRQNVYIKAYSEARIASERELAHTRKVESLGVLAGGVAHEINNQLQPALSMAESLSSEIDPQSKGFRKIQLVLNSISRAKDTVSKILAFSRKEGNRSAICDPVETMRKLEEILSVSLPSSIHFKMDLEDNTGNINISTDELESVIINLINNAAHSIESAMGEISLTLRSVPHTESGKNNVEFIIRDTGKGMDTKTIGKIFDPFFTTKEVGQGTGLGLWQVREILERREGHISVESTLGEGTEMIIRLPKSSSTRRKHSSE